MTRKSYFFGFSSVAELATYECQVSSQSITHELGHQPGHISAERKASSLTSRIHISLLGGTLPCEITFIDKVITHRLENEQSKKE